MTLEQGHAQTNEKEERSTAGGTRASSSCDSLAGAGWRGRGIGKFKGYIPYESRPFSGLTLTPVWQPWNQVLGSLLGDATNDERRQ